MFDIKGVMQQKIKPEFWNRGVIYFQSQKVGSVRVTEKEKSILFNADITGSARKIYFGEITLEKETSKITHYCDCMAHNPTSGCKHVAALALQISDTLYINDLLFVIHRHTKEILAEGLQSDGFIEGIFDSEDEGEDEIPEDISGNKLDIFSQFKQKETQNTKNDTFKYKIKLNFLESYYSHDKNDIELCLYECKPLKSGGFSSGRQIYRNAVQQAPTLFQKYTQFIEYSNSRWHSGSEHITFAESPEYFLQMLFQLEGEIVNKKNKVLHLEKEVLPLKIKTVLQKDGKYLIQLVVESQIKGEVNILKKSVFPAGKTGYFACITKNRYLYFFKSDFNNKFIQEFTQQELLLESEEFESLKQSDYFSDIIQHSSSLVDMGVEKKLGSPKGYLEVEITEDFEEVKIISGIYYTQENIITSENTKNISYFIEGKSVVERNIKKEEEVLVDLSSLLEKCEKKEGEHVKMIDGNIDNFFDMIESYIEKGYVVEYKQNTKRVSNSELGLKVDIKSGIDFFETKTSLTLGGKELEEYAEILSLLGKNKNFNKKSITLKNGMTVLLKENIEESFGLLDELGIQKEKIGENIQIGKHNIGLLHNKNKENNIAFSLDKETVELKKSLENFSGITKVAVPKNVKADLRDYQHTGYNWINFLEKYHFSGILADDMGLGKTLQTLTLLQKVYNKKTLKKQSLVVCPTSLIFNWIDEAKKFTPDLQVEYIKDSKVGFSEISKETQVIIVSYGIIANLVDKEKVPSDFYYLILDESQNIKNPVAKRTKSIGKIQSQYRLALSGTPIENNLMELWSVFNFLMPGFLGNMNHFRTKYLGKTQKEDLLNLSLKTKPFILRRTKEEVLTELPPKQEEVV
ncbi:MAG: DEAD/DEAH box helicase family protein, partial [Candidatus Gracilibacteria bacterium]|nr:DEAD/DEAH box helicase family protein [Candidatus Gracilibacteria bacterium]